MSEGRPKRNLKDIILIKEGGFETKTVTPINRLIWKMPDCGCLVVPMLKVRKSATLTRIHRKTIQ